MVKDGLYRSSEILTLPSSGAPPFAKSNRQSSTSGQPFFPIMDQVESAIVPNRTQVGHEPEVLTPEVKQASRRRHHRG
jgi:hypothetical protein